MSIKSGIQQNLILIPGWRTRRKIVVIESDDWGSIRIPNKATLDVFARKDQRILSDPMTHFDSLESNDDLTALFEVLSSVRDKYDNPAIITANAIVSNPDFDKIKAQGYREYAYENFTKTLKSYPNRGKVMYLIKEGIRNRLFQPQLHGREHVNVKQWLEALQKGNRELLDAFQYRVFGINLQQKISKRNNLMAAFDFEDYNDADEKKTVIEEGAKIFREIFGFTSRSFIATSYIWDSSIEEALSQCGVKYLQGIPYQYIPKPGALWYDRKFHYTGQKNKLGQHYLVRNSFFEPSLLPNTDVVGDCLRRIELAFKWGKPAIIGSHRVNFIGSIEESNRINNLKLFSKLLSNLVKRWHDIEFMSSDELGDLINHERKGLF